jgi:hypothetical protein
VRIPEKLTINDKEYTVTTVGGFATTNIEYVDLPDTVVTLSSRAFAGCHKLVEITFPESLKVIGTAAFSNCSSIEQFNITAGITTIEQSALSECSNLKNIQVDPNNNVFKVVNNCLIYVPTGMLLQGMTSSIIPTDGSVKLLGSYCFARTNIESVIIPEGITEISSNAFSHCEQLTSVTLADSVITLGATCFGWCNKLTNIELPNKLTSILSYVFYRCDLRVVNLPASVKEIKAVSFAENANLTGFNFNSKPTTLEDDVFNNSGKNITEFIINVP